QKNQIGIEHLQAFTQVVDHHAPVEVRQALVDVEGDDPEPLNLHLSPSITIASRFDHEKHFPAAIRQGSHSNARCSAGAMRTGTRAASSSAKTCSTLCSTPGAKRLRHCRYISNVYTTFQRASPPMDASMPVSSSTSRRAACSSGSSSCSTEPVTDCQ